MLEERAIRFGSEGHEDEDGNEAQKDHVNERRCGESSGAIHFP